MQRQEELPEEKEEKIQAKSIAGVAPEEVRRQTEEEEAIQPKRISGAAPKVTSELEDDIQSIRGAGQPLPAAERTFFEPRFGTDFRTVRIHSSGQAAHIARLINARAFTLGHNVVFGADQYSSGNSSGRKLLAHELTHVVQQGVTIFRYTAPMARTEKDRYQDNMEKPTCPTNNAHPVSLTNRSKPRIVQRAPKVIMRAYDPCVDACEKQFNRCLKTTRFYPECIARRGSCLLRCRPSVFVSWVNIPTNRIIFYLKPRGKTGDITLQLLGAGRVAHTIGTWRLAAGRYQTSFNIPRLPVNEYSRVRATWRVDSRNYAHDYPYHIKVLGVYRHSKYNIPAENTCTGAARRAYITDAACNFNRTRLRAGFIAQVNLNGSGISIRHGNLAREQYCLGRPGAPANAAGRSFRQVAAFHGSCGGNTGVLNNATVARRPRHPDLSCYDRIYIHTRGVKTVTDLCPGCAQAQLDNFTTSPACAGILDLGRFVTIKLF